MGQRGVVVQEQQRGTVVVIPLGKTLSFGRNSKMADVLCKDPHVSRKHCTIRAEPDGRLRIEDLGSSSGTYVNKKKVTKALAGIESTISLGRAYHMKVLGMVGAFRQSGVMGEPSLPHWLTDRYLLLGEVGRGGMGVVYEAYDARDNERCAVKWLAPGAAAKPAMADRFRREAELQAVLNDYPGIVSLRDSGTTPGSGDMFCVMEFVEGKTLQRRLRLGIDRLDGVKVVSRIARAVDYAHDHGIVHRDLKPANVLLTANGAVRLTDFGIAKAFMDDDGGITATGVMMGTPGYMAPEQVTDSAKAGPASDVYGAGAILYHVLVGRPPIQGKLLREILESIDKGVFDAPRALDPSVDPELEQICLRALEREPAQRYPTAHALALALEDWLRRHAPAKRVKLRPPGS